MLSRYRACAWLSRLSIQNQDKCTKITTEITDANRKPARASWLQGFNG